MSPDRSTTAPARSTALGTGTLLKAIGTKTYVLRKRYLFNTVTQIAIIYVLFLMVWFGGKAVAPTAIADNLAGITVGFFVWVMAVRAYRALSQDLINEAQWGTLEQLYLTPFGFGRVLAVKTVVNVAESFLWGATILALLLVTTSQSLYVDVVSVVPLVALSLASAAGVGFVLGGLTLLYKRIENVFTLVQFLFVAFIAAPVEQYPLLKLLPLSLGTDLLGSVMGDGLRLWELPALDLGLLVVKATLYLVVGYVVLQRCQYRARVRGVLGHY